MSDTLAAELRAEAKEMRRRDLLNPDRMFDGLHVAIVAFAQRFEDAAAALERAERVVEAAKQFAEHNDETRGDKCAHGAGYNVLQRELRRSLAAYDTTRADTVRAERPSQADETPDQHLAGLNAEGEKK